MQKFRLFSKLRQTLFEPILLGKCSGFACLNDVLQNFVQQICTAMQMFSSDCKCVSESVLQVRKTHSEVILQARIRHYEPFEHHLKKIRACK